MNIQSWGQMEQDFLKRESLQNSLKYNETDQDVDYEHKKKCLDAGVLVCIVKHLHTDTLWCEIYDEKSSGLYEIQLNRMDTPEKVLRWVQQLSKKGWVTTEHITQLLDILDEQKIISAYGLT